MDIELLEIVATPRNHCLGLGQGGSECRPGSRPVILEQGDRPEQQVLVGVSWFQVLVAASSLGRSPCSRQASRAELRESKRLLAFEGRNTKLLQDAQTLLGLFHSFRMSPFNDGESREGKESRGLTLAIPDLAAQRKHLIVALPCLLQIAESNVAVAQVTHVIGLPVGIFGFVVELAGTLVLSDRETGLPQALEEHSEVVGDSLLMMGFAPFDRDLQDGPMVFDGSGDIA